MAGVRRPLVLLVAAPDEARATLVESLRSSHLDVQCADSASECIRLVRQLLPAVIVMHRELPDGDGWELVRILRSLSSTRDVPVVAVTADDARRHVERAVLVGCDAFLVKPFEPEVLLRQIGRLLSRVG
jgi:CheY-like chemotaxis protein